MATVALLPSTVRATESRFAERLRAALDGSAAPGLDTVVLDVVTLAAPVVGVAAALALTAGLVQTRGAVFSWSRPRERAGTRASRWRLTRGGHAARATLGAVLLLSLVLAAAYTLQEKAPVIATTAPSARRALDLAGTLLLRFGCLALVILVAASAVDYGFEHASWRSRLRMSRREVDAERREHEGSPEVRRARRGAQEELLRRP